MKKKIIKNNVQKVMKESSQTDGYLKDWAKKKESFKKLYKAEQVIFNRFLKKDFSVLDIGCLLGSHRESLKKFKIKYNGLDVDAKAIAAGKKKYKGISIFCDDFLKPKKKINKYDFVFSLNVFDHYINWKDAIKAYKQYSKRYIFFTSHLKTTGPTILDKETSFIAYDPPKTILWAVHNIFELIAFASSYEIGAKNVYVYAYNKFHKKNWLGPDNRKLAGVSNFPIDPREILVGGVVIELNKNFKKENTGKFSKSRFQIYINNSLYLKSWW